MKHAAIRIFGVLCLAIGLWLMAGLIPVIDDMLAGANSRRDMTGVIAMPMLGLLMIAFGVGAVWRPEWMKNA